MHASKISLAGAAALLCLALMTANHELSAERAAAQVLADEKTKQAAAIEELARVEKSTTDAEQAAATLQKEHDLLTKALASAAHENAAGSNRGSTAASESVAAGNAFLAAHPEVAAALNDFSRAHAHARYGNALKQAGFTPEQIDRLEGLLSRDGIGLPSVGQSPAMMLMSHSELGAREVPRLINEIAGTDGAEKLRQIQDASVALLVAQRTAAALTFSETPLTSEQCDQLAQTLSAHRIQTNRGPKPFDWAAILNDAGHFLQPPQLEALAGEQARAERGRLDITPFKTVSANPAP